MKKKLEVRDGKVYKIVERTEKSETIVTSESMYNQAERLELKAHAIRKEADEIAKLEKLEEKIKDDQ